MSIKRLDQLPNAPLTGGPYVQAVVHNGFVYLAGQIPWDCVQQQLFVGNVSDETKNIFENLAVILKACGSSLQHVIRVTAFLTDTAQAKDFSTVYKSMFPADALPVRTMVIVKGLPLGASIELEVTAAVI